jgi:hypothetical protein
MDLRPLALEGAHARLEPPALAHLDALVEAGREWGLTRELVRAGIEEALRDQAAGTALPFATVHRPSGRVVGGTRFREAVAPHRRVEIGSTCRAGANPVLCEVCPTTPTVHRRLFTSRCAAAGPPATVSVVRAHTSATSSPPRRPSAARRGAWRGAATWEASPWPGHGVRGRSAAPAASLRREAPPR